MAVKNKLEKFLLGLSSIFLAVLIVLGLKVKDDKNRLALLENELNSSYNLKNITATQKLIGSDREKTLNKVGGLSKIDSKIVIPTKTVTQPASVMPIKSMPRMTRTS